jgi:predicted glutamine amidotransferase
MEYLMFLLHNGKLDDAKQVTQVNSCYLIRKDMDVSECEIKVIRLID